MKLAIVHDMLREYGGAERVLEAIHEIWPEAPVYTSFTDWQRMGEHARRFGGWDIRTSWVEHNWLVKKFHSPLRFLAPRVWESFDLSEYDVVLTSSGWWMCRGVHAGRRDVQLSARALVADEHLDPSSDSLANKSSSSIKAISLAGEDGLNVIRSPHAQVVSNVIHPVPFQICYIHHPPRNLYGYATGGIWQRYWPVRVYTAIINFFLRQYDFRTAQKVDWFIANSRETAKRVEKFYRRKSTVIYPPVEVKNEKLKVKSERTYFISVGRLMWAKRIDLIIQAVNELKLPLKIVGAGPEEENLKKIAGPTVEFMGPVSDEDLDRLYAGAKALIFMAQDEDFGIVPVEAMGRGIPVITLAQGGVLETVADGVTGVYVEKPDKDALVSAIQKFEELSKKKEWKKVCIRQAEKFGKERFKKELKKFVELKVA